MKLQRESQKPANPSDDRRLTPTGWLMRLVIYSSVMSSMVLPVFQNDPFWNFNFFDGAAKARNFEGRNYVGTINRSLQAYYLEYGMFTDSIGKLGIGIPSETPNYRYQIWVVPEQGPFQVSNDRFFSPSVIVTATAIGPNLNSYSGIVSLDRSNSQSRITISGICKTLQPSPVPPLLPSVSPTQDRFKPSVHCPNKSQPL